jgi:hypothetical protein
MHLYLARNCVKVSSQHLDINEHLTVTAYRGRSSNMVMEGQINANTRPMHTQNGKNEGE